MGLKITFISDTHSQHEKLTELLPGGHILCFTGDCCEDGYQREAHNFMKWFGNIKSYDYKVMIAGNHDCVFEWQPKLIQEMLQDTDMYGDLIYLQDEAVELFGIKIYGSPWQPAYRDWSFNLPRDGVDIEHKWSQIPDDTDILLTHGPPYKLLDYYYREHLHVGCKKLQDRVLNLNPLIHAFGHVHGSYGVKYFNKTTFINSAFLDEKYDPTNKPITLDLDLVTNQLTYDN